MGVEAGRPPGSSPSGWGPQAPKGGSSRRAQGCLVTSFQSPPRVPDDRLSVTLSPARPRSRLSSLMTWVPLGTPSCLNTQTRQGAKEGHADPPPTLPTSPGFPSECPLNRAGAVVPWESLGWALA